MSDHINDILKRFERTSDQFFSKGEFRAKLRSGKKLRIKYGVDVTAPTLHIGHAVNLWLLRSLQNMGHKVVFVIGDFTTRIGDPDGRMETRPVIPKEDIERNADEFIKQAKMVLRFDDPNLIEIRRNSEWLDKLPMQEFMQLLSMVTHKRLLSRDMFQLRLAAEQDIYMHEILYPVLQGYDSVAIESDLTIIGSDQLFNEMMGRLFQERMGQKPQTIITTKITAGIDGKLKQSKSIGNYIGLAHAPRDKFGRVMSIPDALIEEYFRIYTDLPLEEIDRMKDLFKLSPREAKLKLAYAIVGRYHGHDVAVAEREWFEHTVSKGLVPDDIPELAVLNPRQELQELVFQARPGKSKSDSRRLIKQGAVEVNGEKKESPEEELVLRTNDVLKVGKRNWFRIEVVHLNELDTEQLSMKPMRVEDVDMIQQFLPEWEIVKHLSRPMPAKVISEIARDVFRRILLQPEPKDDWLWRVSTKKDPDKIIGVAHLRRDGDTAKQSLWIDPQEKGKGYAKEAIGAVTVQAFNSLNFDKMIFEGALPHAGEPQELEILKEHFMFMEETFRNRENPEGIFGFTKDGWERMKEWWLKHRPDANLPSKRRHNEARMDKIEDAHEDRVEDIMERYDAKRALKKEWVAEEDAEQKQEVVEELTSEKAEVEAEHAKKMALKDAMAKTSAPPARAPIRLKLPQLQSPKPRGKV